MKDIVGLKTERIGSVKLYISSAHRFGTDAFLLADFAAPRHKDNVIDLCSGCGIVAAVMYERFRPKTVTAIEIDPEGTRLFEQSIQDSAIDSVSAICADLRLFKVQREVDVITCNPPYFSENAGYKSEKLSAANARHELLCSLSDVCECASRSLKYGGRLCICNRPERLCDIMCAMRNSGIEPKRIKFVAKTPDDPPWLVLAEGRKGGKPFLSVEKNFYTQNLQGEPSDELKGVYVYSHIPDKEKK